MSIHSVQLIRFEEHRLHQYRDGNKPYEYPSASLQIALLILLITRKWLRSLRTRILNVL